MISSAPFTQSNLQKRKISPSKKNKVVAIVYTKNLDQFYEYPNKEATAPKLTFQAPKGEKITTKKINGKKVYLLPRGTKIKKQVIPIMQAGWVCMMKMEIYWHALLMVFIMT